MAEKSELRLRARKINKSITAEVRAMADARIEEAVLSLKEVQNAGTVFVYVSMPNEPATHSLIEKLLAEGKRVCVPRCKESPYMDAFEIKSLADLTPGAMNILEPAEGCRLADPETFDISIIPCVAAGLNGERLGHGAGFYDMYLPKTRGLKICLCYRVLLFEDIPMSPTDTRMDIVLTD